MSGIERDIDIAKKIAEMVADLGGRVFFVGGFVRDRLMGVPNKDVDIEVHGVTPRQLEGILDGIGQRLSMGESFGVYGLKGYGIDIAMPRKEEARGKGHRDFDIMVDPFIGTRGAAVRRDFTVNAMMQDVLTGEVIDEFNGKSDLEKGIIRHINDKTFIEDPLRVLRGAQFAARFGFDVAKETVELCGTMDLSYLAKERVMGELEKALLKSDKPSVFFEIMRRVNGLDVWFPELKALIGVEQNPYHHSEGDVWVHTMMVLDVAVRYRDVAKDHLGFMLSAVTHDFGKAICTERIKGEIHAYGHDIKGLPLVESFMKRLTNEKGLIEYVLNLSEHHMKPNALAVFNSSIKATNKLYDSTDDPLGLIYIAISDGLGKTMPRPYESYEGYLLERLEVYKEYMSRPYVMGRDLIEAGLTPGEGFSDYLAYAHKLRLAGIDKESALKQTLAYARKTEKQKGKKG